MTEERRRYPRGGRRLNATQRIGNRTVERTVTGISSGGVFVEGEDVATRVGELVVLELEVGDGEPALKITAEVVRISERGAGLRVTRADWDQLSQLVG